MRELVTGERAAARCGWTGKRALFSAWYEFFPRSEGTVDQRGTPVGTARSPPRRPRLPAVAEMGFDVLYLPPIHPIGRVNRKGRNNTLVAGDDDVGSPWAIGAAEGGHDAIHPDLGTLAGLPRASSRPRGDNGLEVAMDLALQCAPDHPWVTEHPEWFTTQADGTIAYAENPPKKYQDIYPLNFDNDPEGIRAEILRVVLHWVEQGVKIFRVDNPHTKPVDFWHWLIGEVKERRPGRAVPGRGVHPAGDHARARARSASASRTPTSPGARRRGRCGEYCEELVAAADYMRPNFWPNTPDILHETLQHGGPPMFKIRAVLAEHALAVLGHVRRLRAVRARAAARRRGVPGQREVPAAPPRLGAAPRRPGGRWPPFLARLNAIRRANPALHWLRNLRFHEVDNPAILCWSKRDPRAGNTVLVVCSLRLDAACSGPTPRWTCPRSGSTGTSGSPCTTS